VTPQEDKARYPNKPFGYQDCEGHPLAEDPGRGRPDPDRGHRPKEFPARGQLKIPGFKRHGHPMPAAGAQHVNLRRVQRLSEESMSAEQARLASISTVTSSANNLEVLSGRSSKPD
jgi:hypothetical protein